MTKIQLRFLSFFQLRNIPLFIDDCTYIFFARMLIKQNISLRSREQSYKSMTNFSLFSRLFLRSFLR